MSPGYIKSTVSGFGRLYFTLYFFVTYILSQRRKERQIFKNLLRPWRLGVRIYLDFFAALASWRELFHQPRPLGEFDHLEAVLQVQAVDDFPHVVFDGALTQA